ncbi:MAG: hypothetical protein H0V88_02185 [Pyrinomonadaceae bacterium]|nr:hypothetical protein [Pyrinomonadaceae bacterium]
MNYISLQTCFNRVLLAVIALCCFSVVGDKVHAQSTNPDAPTPVRANTITAQIMPLDVGDARLTRHFYRFSGAQGDLVITVESQNLNGGIDLFTANGLRPLTQVVLYAAGQTTTRASKSIYLRQPEELMLRIEARSPNDDPGSYRISFTGVFVAAKSDETNDGSATTEQSESPNVATNDNRRNARRVSSVGARIETSEAGRREENATVPATESAAAVTNAPATTPNEISPTSDEPTPVASPAPRARRGRTSTARRAAARRRSSRPAPATAARRTPTRRAPPAEASTDETTAPTAPASQPAQSPRLIIETRDGARLERPMSSVRRVTVDNNQLVIILNNGKVERQAMTNVLRFSIEP